MVLPCAGQDILVALGFFKFGWGTNASLLPAVLSGKQSFCLHDRPSKEEFRLPHRHALLIDPIQVSSRGHQESIRENGT